MNVFKVHSTAPGTGSTLLSAEVSVDYLTTTFREGCTRAEAGYIYKRCVKDYSASQGSAWRDSCKHSECSSPHNQQITPSRHSFFCQYTWPLKPAFSQKPWSSPCLSAFPHTVSVLCISLEPSHTKYKYALGILLYGCMFCRLEWVSSWTTYLLGTWLSPYLIQKIPNLSCDEITVRTWLVLRGITLYVRNVRMCIRFTNFKLEY